MLTLTRPEGSEPQDFNISRRGLALGFFAGYAAFSAAAEAAPIVTDEEGLVTERVLVPSTDRPIPAYVARPVARGRHPTIVVVSEVFGVHEYIRDVCRRLAKGGYVAIAPDYFARYGDPAPLTDFGEIRKIVSRVTYEQSMADTWGTLNFLRGTPYADARRMGITGFCWGGAVVWQAVERFNSFRAGVAWYGRLARPKPGDFLSEPERLWPIDHVSDLKAPVLGLYAGKDNGIPVSDVEQMRGLLRQYGKRGSDIVVYPEAQHGFHADYRSSYDPAAAQDGWARMLAHFRSNGLAPRRGLF